MELLSLLFIKALCHHGSHPRDQKGSSSKFHQHMNVQIKVPAHELQGPSQTRAACRAKRGLGLGHGVTLKLVLLSVRDPCSTLLLFITAWFKMDARAPAFVDDQFQSTKRRKMERKVHLLV
jgi:hypothetical protein